MTGSAADVSTLEVGLTVFYVNWNIRDNYMCMFVILRSRKCVESIFLSVVFIVKTLSSSHCEAVALS